MRNNYVFLLLFSFYLSLCETNAVFAKTLEEGIKVQVENESLPQVFKRLEKVYGCQILFVYNDVNSYSFTGVIQEKNAGDAVKKVLEGKPFICKVDGTFINVALAKRTYQEKSGKIRVSGKVIDDKGMPMVGVHVQTVGDVRSGVITDMDGKFSMSLPADNQKRVVELSFIGMVTERIIIACNKDALDLLITLQEDNEKLSEVVVTGYQQIDRRHLTSAVSSVSMEDIQMPGITNLTQMLEGKIPDMVVANNSGEINATPRLRVRGTSTIIGNREPLWVVDGIIVNDPVNLSPDVLNDPDYVNRIGNAISGLNPQDIERLDVLKDAAATALYGTRAANGVIVVTTKKGRAGKPEVAYSGTMTFRRRPYYTDDKINLMNSKERIQFSENLVGMHYIYPQNMPLVGYEYALHNLYNGTYTNSQFQSEVMRLQTMNTDWFDILTRNSFSTDHNVNISGGSENIRYYASLGYTDENDVIRWSDNKRYTANGKLDMILSPKLHLSFHLNGYLNEKTYTQDALNPIDYAYNTSRAIPAYTDNGDYAFYKKYGSVDIGYLNYNILNELDNSYQKQNVSSFTATANLRYQATDWLSFNGVISASTSNADLTGYWGEKTYYAACLRGCEYGAVPPQDWSYMPYGGELSKQTTRNKSYTARLQANFSKTFNETHYVSAVLGTEANSNRYEAFRTTERGYFEDRGKAFISDISTDYVAYTKWLLGNVPTVTDSQLNLLSAYMTASYSYSDYFTLNANMRYDGSNKFGSRSNEKILPIWSVSGMVDLNRVLSLNKIVEPLDALTFKASYGEQGNMLDGQTSELVIRKGSMNSYYNELYSTVHAFANPDLKWEKTQSLNLALEGALWNNRLQFGLEYYYKKTNDAFMEKAISDINGYTSYVVNSGTVVNRGYNLHVTAIPVRKKDIYWSISGSMSKIMNEMRTNPSAQAYDLSSFLNGTAVVKGHSLNTFWSYDFTGLNPKNGGPMFNDWSDRKGEVEQMDKLTAYTNVLIPSGQRDPDITGSLHNTFSYKSWKLNVGLYYSLGAKTRLFRVFKNFVSGYSSELNMNKALLQAWSKPGDEKHTNIPAVMGMQSDGYGDYRFHWSSNYDWKGAKLADNSWDMYDYSNARVVSANYLKISSLSLTYEVPIEWLKNYHIKRLALTLGATNLYTFCHKDLKGQTPTQSGFSEVQLSDTPTYTFGLAVNF